MKKFIVTILALMIITGLFESCKRKKGCTNIKATNYDSGAKEDDGSCKYDTLPVARKIAGIWKVNTYLLNGQDQTAYFDTAYRDYALHIDTPSSHYSIQWNHYNFIRDSAMLVDTLGYDSVNMVWNIHRDTIHFTDTTIIPHLAESGSWDLLNNNADLRLHSDSNVVNIYHILGLDPGNLKLQKGSEEYHFWKFH